MMGHRAVCGKKNQALIKKENGKPLEGLAKTAEVFRFQEAIA